MWIILVATGLWLSRMWWRFPSETSSSLPKMPQSIHQLCSGSVPPKQSTDRRRQYCSLDGVDIEASMKMCLWLTKHPAYKIVPINEYEEYLTHCLFVFLQNPREADAMTKVQAELDETKIILVKYFPKLGSNTLIKRMTCAQATIEMFAISWLILIKELMKVWYLLRLPFLLHSHIFCFVPQEGTNCLYGELSGKWWRGWNTAGGVNCKRQRSDVPLLWCLEHSSSALVMLKV